MAMTVRLPGNVNEQLRKAAHEDHQSMQAVVVTAISDYLDRREARYIREIARGVANRDAEILDELSRS